MLKRFREARMTKLVQALQNGDRERLTALARRIEQQQLSAPLHEGMTALEIALQAGQPDALAWVLEQGIDANGSSAAREPYLLLALRHPQHSLALLSALLRAGADANTCFEGRSLLHWCFEHCAPEALMLHLSRLVQHGARLDEGSPLVGQAMQREDQATVHFLIHSGAPLPEQLDRLACSEAMRLYARRCADDKRIREMMLGR
jgi:hypothetical protein